MTNRFTIIIHRYNNSILVVKRQSDLAAIFNVSLSTIRRKYKDPGIYQSELYDIYVHPPIYEASTEDSNNNELLTRDNHSKRIETVESSFNMNDKPDNNVHNSTSNIVDEHFSRGLVVNMNDIDANNIHTDTKPTPVIDESSIIDERNSIDISFNVNEIVEESIQKKAIDWRKEEAKLKTMEAYEQFYSDRTLEELQDSASRIKDRFQLGVINRHIEKLLF